MCTAWQWRNLCLNLYMDNSSVYLLMISVIIQYLKIITFWAVWYTFTILEEPAASIFPIPQKTKIFKLRGTNF
jgi:hypothetical protein